MPNYCHLMIFLRLCCICWHCFRREWVLCHIGHSCQPGQPKLTPSVPIQASKFLISILDLKRDEACPYEKFYNKLNSQGLAWDFQITHNLVAFFWNEKKGVVYFRRPVLYLKFHEAQRIQNSHLPPLRRMLFASSIYTMFLSTSSGCLSLFSWTNGFMLGIKLQRDGNIFHLLYLSNWRKTTNKS